MDKKDEQELERWKERLEQIEGEVKGMLFLRHIYDETHKMVQDSPIAGEPSDFYGFLGECYAAAVASCIRRLVSTRRNDVSLLRLLEAIGRRRPLVSEEQHLAGWKKLHPDLPHLENIESPGLESCPGWTDGELSKEQIETDIGELKQTTDAVRAYVNEYIAHCRSREDRKKPPTWAGLNDAVDFVASLTNRYRFMLLGEDRELEPVVLDNWKDVFRVAWATEVDT